MTRPLSVGLLAVVLFGLASGCVEGDTSDVTAPEAETSEPSGDVGEATITGSVVDSELTPIPGAMVSATPGDYTATTGASGEYTLGPMPAGTYTLSAARAGYSGKAVQVEVVGGEPLRVILTLEQLPSGEAFFETRLFDGYIQCQWHLTSPVTLNVPCSTFGLEYFGGPQSIDVYRFTFDISTPGFQEVVFEADWEPSATVQGGGQFWIDNPETNEIDPYVFGLGERPLWQKATAGIQNEGGDAVFYPTPDAVEQFGIGLIGYGAGDSTVPNFYHWIEWRYTIYLSLFYNGPVQPGFTALPG